MAKITLYNEQPVTATYVPNIFIDDYMTQANGEYVKIYLYLLRSIDQVGHSFSLSQIADHFDCTERDILRALKYWEKLHLFRLEYDENQNLSGICFLTDAMSAVPTRKEVSKGNVTNHFIQTSAPARLSYSVDEMKSFCEKKDVSQLIFITERYLGRTLNHSDLNFIFFWYDELHFSTDLIEFLIENCVAKGHTSLHYMQRIAEDFSARQIRTVDDARNLLNQDTSACHAVMKAFGIRGRNLVPSEMNFIKSWHGKMGFSTELITEACNRTMSSIHEPSFGYANSILEKWQKQGIHTLEEVEKADEVYQQAQRSKHPKTASANTNRFLNFKQRDNNYEDLQRQLLQKSLQ